MIPKNKRVRLTGKRASEFHRKIYVRDRGKCIYCGKPVPYGIKHHHEPCGPYKSDEEEKAVMLCNDCHYQRHNSPKTSKAIERYCVKYLRELYGEKGAKRE